MATVLTGVVMVNEEALQHACTWGVIQRERIVDTEETMWTEKDQQVLEYLQNVKLPHYKVDTSN